MQSSLQKDIVTLNRRYLLLVKQMAAEKYPLLSSSVPNSVLKSVLAMSLEDIDRLAEDMVAPCFNLSITEAVYKHMEKQKPGAQRKAYHTNVIVTQPQTDGKS